MAKWVMNTIYSTGYFGIMLLTLVESVFPPIPSEVIMPLAGFLVAQGKLSLAGVVVAGTFGSVLGALPLYYLGRAVGEERLKELADRHGHWLTLSRKDTDRAKSWFDKHGGRAVFVCRLVPGMRSYISIPAGIDKMNLATFWFCTAAGAAIWTALLSCLGYFLGGSFGKVGEHLDPASWVVLGGVVAIYFVRVIRHKGRGHTLRKAQLNPGVSRQTFLRGGKVEPARSCGQGVTAGEEG